MKSHCSRAEGDGDHLMSTGKNWEGQSWAQKQEHHPAAAQAPPAIGGQFKSS